jgi:hypothetical protein
MDDRSMSQRQVTRRQKDIARLLREKTRINRDTILRDTRKNWK